MERLLERVRALLLKSFSCECDGVGRFRGCYASIELKISVCGMFRTIEYRFWEVLRLVLLCIALYSSCMIIPFLY